MNREKVIISGVNGFVGKYVARELYKDGTFVIGIGQEPTVNNSIGDIVSEYHQVDLVKEWPNIPDVKAVIHLAGLTNVGKSYEEPQKYISANSSMLTNLCEYYIKQENKPRIIIVSSGTIYSPNQPMPINENGLIDIASPYTISKLLNENQAKYYRNRGLDCVIVRPFNHIGPGQEQGFILPDFYNRLATLQEGEHKIITGNIETSRDYTDVRDIVRAYSKIALAKELKNSIYNICSGVSLSGIDIFNALKNSMKLPDIDYEIDQSLVRPTDIKNIVGDYSLIKDELGWEPKISISQTVADFVESKSS